MIFIMFKVSPFVYELQKLIDRGEAMKPTKLRVSLPQKVDQGYKQCSLIISI